MAPKTEDAELIGGPFDGEYFQWNMSHQIIRRSRCGLLPTFTCKENPAEPEIVHYEYLYYGQSDRTGRHLFFLDRILE